MAEAVSGVLARCTIAVSLTARGICSDQSATITTALHWEDRSLISLVALQLAAYLVQRETTQALADARQLEQFNKRFAFILHDTKNAMGSSHCLREMPNSSAMTRISVKTWL